MTFQHGFRLFPAIAAEMGMQQIDHRPQMTPLFDIDLKQIAQIVERRAGQAEKALLLDRCRFGIALGDDQAAQRAAMFARDFLPHGLALVFAKGDFPVRIGIGEKNPPAIFRHLDVAEISPALGIDADRGAEINIEIQRPLRAEIFPPVQKARLPGFERALQTAVVAEIDVVRNAGREIDRHNLDPPLVKLTALSGTI